MHQAVLLLQGCAATAGGVAIAIATGILVHGALRRLEGRLCHSLIARAATQHVQLLSFSSSCPGFVADVAKVRPRQFLSQSQCIRSLLHPLRKWNHAPSRSCIRCMTWVTMADREVDTAIHESDVH
jgi:hypothetical protein